jgi:hypothetical protein
LEGRSIIKLISPVPITALSNSVPGSKGIIVLLDSISSKSIPVALEIVVSGEKSK